MSDRELLELAAKAAGYGEIWTLDNYPNTFYIGPRYTGGAPKYRAWNPLTDDGDALRLAVKLFDGDDMEVIWHNARRLRAERPELDEVAAIRHAIVRDAAEIGRT